MTENRKPVPAVGTAVFFPFESLFGANGLLCEVTQVLPSKIANRHIHLVRPRGSYFFYNWEDELANRQAELERQHKEMMRAKTQV